MKKIFKYLFYLVIIGIIGLAVFTATKNGSYDVNESKIIKAPISVVFDKVNNLKSWEKWGPWKKEDSTMVFSYSSKTIGKGASYSWTGMINGSMETTQVIHNKEIIQDLSLLTPFGERNPKVYWNFEEVEEGTKVTWGMKGEHPFLDKLYYIFSEENFNDSMKKMHINGLEGIATHLKEDMQKYIVTEEGIKEYGGGYYMYTSGSSTQNSLGDKIGPMMNKVAHFTTQQNIAVTGMPFTIYNEWDSLNGTVNFSTAIPVKERVIVVSGEVLCGFMPSLTAVKTILQGDYSNLPEAYKKAERYIVENNLMIDASKKRFEVYANDPSTTPNPANWITEIYIPIKTN